jgi:hypothetical protein
MRYLRYKGGDILVKGQHDYGIRVEIAKDNNDLRYMITE